MRAADHLTGATGAAHCAGVPPETTCYYVGRDRLLDDGKWLRGELIAGPFADPFDATGGIALCGDKSAHVIKITTFGDA